MRMYGRTELSLQPDYQTDWIDVVDTHVDIGFIPYLLFRLLVVHTVRPSMPRACRQDDLPRPAMPDLSDFDLMHVVPRRTAQKLNK